MARVTLHPWTLACVPLFVIAAFASFALAEPAQDLAIVDPHVRRVVYGGDRDFPPLESLSIQGEPQGFQIDLIREIACVNEWDLHIVLGSWDDIHARFRAGEIDIVAMADRPVRRTYADFADAHSVFASEIFQRIDSPSVDSLEQLAGHEVIVQESALADEWFAAKKVDASLIRVKTEADALRLLASGKHDFAVVSQFGGRSAMSRLALRNLTTCGPLTLKADYAFAVRTGRADLLVAINQGQDILKATGDYNTIYDRWLGDIERPGKTLVIARKIALWVAFPLLALITVAMMWNRSLRRQVGRRTAALTSELALRHSAETALRESETRYKTLTEHAPEAILVIDPQSMRIVESNQNAARIFKTNRDALFQSDPLTLIASTSPDESLDPLDAQDLIERAINGEAVHAERIIRDTMGASMPCELRIVRIAFHDRWVVRISITDISERRTSQRRQESMMAELDHRVKNTLAMVSGLARHMLDESSDPVRFAPAFNQRLRAMSEAHEALAKNSWDGVRLDGAIALALKPYGPWPNPRVSITGDNPMLAPDTATPICMVLHELAINATKHGALAAPQGSLILSATVAKDHTLTFTWTENVPSAPTPTINKGVGTSLIKGLIEFQLRGSALVVPIPGGLSWSFSIPASAIVPDDQATPHLITTPSPTARSSARLQPPRTP